MLVHLLLFSVRLTGSLRLGNEGVDSDGGDRVGLWGGNEFREEKPLLHVLFGETSACSSGGVKMQSGPGKGGRRLCFLVSFAQGSFAVVHSVVFGFAGRKGSRKAKEWPVVTSRKGRENPYLLWPVGDRERGVSFCSGRDVCVRCQLSMTAEGGGRELWRGTPRFGSGNVRFSQNASVAVNTE